jgi:hypothetical protein
MVTLRDSAVCVMLMAGLRDVAESRPARMAVSEIRYLPETSREKVSFPSDFVVTFAGLSSS